ncbi:hypothetical protein [Roseovarius phycicola]|uniref:Uncharacterized protein n=1 Tax=Roseovarius phycicola TaxID=3080976 RepID=A0ABZ2HQ06_9RHOB
MKTLVNVLLERLIDIAYALETASDSEVNSDFAVKILEMTAAGLQNLDQQDLESLQGSVESFAKNEVDPSRRQFLGDFVENFGLSSASTSRGLA